MERLTVSGQFLGTPIYMGPEQATGALASPRMDVWSLGVLLYEACCKEVPVEARSRVQLRGQLSIGNYERPTVHTPSLPASFVSVIDKALAKAPADRYPDGQAFAADLDLALAGEFTQAQAEAKLSRWARIVSRVRAAPFSSLAVIVAVAAVGSSLAYRAPAARPSIEDAPAVPALRADVAAVETVGEVVAAGRALDELVPSELGSEWLSRLRERAVEAEDPMSQMRLADYFALGRRGVSRNLEAARALYRALIAGGEREAFSRLGTLELTEGNGAEACALFEQGAERGDASAWLGLGRLYEAGSGGVRLDLARARECYGLARQQRSQVGAAEFGRCLVRGVGGSREPARGMEILHTAFRGREGAKWASAYLGRILLTGAPGVPADRPKALVFLQQAFAKGYPDPRLGLELGQEFQRDGSRVLAIDTLASAYAQGVPEAGVELALVLTSGEPTVEEQRRALELLEAATTAGTPGAAEGLSRLLDSVFADEALRVLKRLAEAGDPDARATLSLREGSPR
jgi:TPR repeat protein